ncbi:PDR/VanB family oxidoreductase [Kribbella sp. NPDC048915]|uniref:PDR/VanB family oxidoreductase n=1 Tax=Kribbella sp. NPDC048915 TaxID=3155148 RepID=UPI0033D5F04A
MTADAVSEAADDLPVIVTALTWEGHGLVSVTLTSPDDAVLPAWTAGAHIDLVLPNGMRRQYSLCGSPGDRRTYQVTVDRVQDTRGGSEYVHLFLRPGQRVRVGRPRNHFALSHTESAWLFLAGGVGITPFLPLVEEASGTATPWRLHYVGRARDRMAHLRGLERLGKALGADQEIHVHDTSVAPRPTVDQLIAELPSGAGIYACGPQSLLDDCETSCARRPDLVFHAERFRPRDLELPDPQPFTLVAQRSALTVSVPSDRSALQMLEQRGVRVPSGCRTGLCGACQVTVLAGEIEHRDDVLTAGQRAGGRVMLPCVSRSAGGELVLDV